MSTGLGRSALCALAGSVALAAAQSDTGRQASSSAPVTFVDVAGESGVRFEHVNGASPEKHLVETMGSGGLFFDFDGDGWLDIFVVDGGSLVDRAAGARAAHRLYRNRRDGSFADVSRASGITARGYGLGACAADYDNDGDADLFVTGAGANTLYRNDGDGTFTDVTRAAGVGASALSTSCAFADLDGDGFLDLFVVTYVDPADNAVVCGNGRVRAYCRPDVYPGLPDLLYANDGDGTFTDVSARAGLGAVQGKGLGVVATDVDDDGRVDVFVANDLTPNTLYRNQGGWRFEDVALRSGVAVASDGRIRAGMGTDVGDYDGDGLMDLVVTNFELETHSLFRSLGGGLFADATVESGIGLATLAYLGFGTVFADLDNDGDLDLAIANGHVLDNTALFRSTSKYGQRNLLLRNDGGRFREVGATAGSGFQPEKVSRGLFAGDYDNDGDLDLLVTNNGQPVDLLRNDGARGGAVLLTLVGTRSNRGGIGARLTATIRGRTQVRDVRAGSSYLGQNDLRVHIGLGDAAAIERLVVRWPSGTVETLGDVGAGQRITLTEGRGITARAPMIRR